MMKTFLLETPNIIFLNFVWEVMFSNALSMQHLSFWDCVHGVLENF